MNGNMIEDGDFVMSNIYGETKGMIGVVNNKGRGSGFHVNFGPDKMAMHSSNKTSNNWFYMESDVQKLEVGDKVRMKSKSVWGPLASSPIYKRSDNGIGYFRGFDDYYGKQVAVVNDTNSGYNGDFFMAHDLEFISKGEEEMAQFKVDNIVKDEDGDYRKVLGVYKDVTFLSQYEIEYEDALKLDGREVYSYTTSEMEEFTLVKEKPLKEVSMQEIADKFGVKVEELRVKE